MAERGWPEEARELFERGYEAQEAGRLDEAIECYRRSLALHASAEAHTFIGWALAQQGKHEEAIEACREAIAVDPTFGNPYNDIGAYLIELGREDEAIPWLKQAMDAPRYEAPQFPHVNLARIYEKKGQVLDAVGEYGGGREKQEGYETAFG